MSTPISLFSQLKLNSSLLNSIKAQGYQTPTPIQARSIPLILAGNDIMASAQTGTGKTAAFALPILHNLIKADLPNSQLRALVLTPTRELAQQVHKNLVQYGQNSHINTGLVYGGASLNVQIEQLKSGVDVLVATPGRLLDLMFKGVVELNQLETLVFDEADRMLDMGFKDEIDKILKSVPKSRQTLLFSATFDETIISLSKTLLKDPKLVEVNERNSSAESVEQIVYSVDNDRKRALISYLIGSKNWQQVLIFTRKRQTADALAKEMCKDGLKTQSIHGEKSQGARERALEAFKSGETRVLVATDVAARGLDIDALNFVVNFELPYNAEDYIHRIGRTGRAGSTGTAISLVSPNEAYLLEEVEVILDRKLGQQWLAGFEPDLDKAEREAKKSKNHKNSRGAQKKRAKNRAFGNNTQSNRRPRRK